MSVLNAFRITWNILNSIPTPLRQPPGVHIGKRGRDQFLVSYGNGRVSLVYAEMLTGTHHYDIGTAQPLVWGKRQAGCPLTTEERQRVFRDLQAFFSLNKIPVIMDGAPVADDPPPPTGTEDAPSPHPVRSTPGP